MYLSCYDLTGQTAVVTGGSQGIGLACVEALGEAGAFVYILDRVPDVGQSAVTALAGKSCKAAFLECDVTHSARVRECADTIMDECGRVDVLVCNAGIARSETAAEEVADADWLSVMDVNVNGLFWCCRAFGRHMLEAGSGSIINIGSMSGLIVNKPQPQAAYNASKAAVHQLTKSLAAEWGARGVRVNAIAPTYINTPMTAAASANAAMFDTWIAGTPMARLGEPHEIASIVLFLASRASSLMTGSIVVADAGYTCW